MNDVVGVDLWFGSLTYNGKRIGEGKDLKNKMFNLKIKYNMKTITSKLHRHFAFAYVLLVAIIFCGCETTIKRTNMEEQYNGFLVRKVVIDSCEYIYANLDIKSLTHKGNCKFCSERSKK